jgi:hypothetical protein
MTIIEANKPQISHPGSKSGEGVMSAPEILHNAIRFLGYGDPETARLWFFGIEETLQFKSLDELMRTIKTPFEQYQGCKDSQTTVYPIMSKVAIGLLGQNWQEQWPEYRDKKLFSTGSEVVQANLYPLGKARVSKWPDEYVEWFGLDQDQYLQWIADDNSGRFAFIRKTRSEYQNPLTICFGATVWHDFIKCFNLEYSLFIGYQDLFRFYPHERVILTPFFWSGGKSGMSDALIQRFIELINHLQMNPFKESKQLPSGLYEPLSPIQPQE